MTELATKKKSNNFLSKPLFPLIFHRVATDERGRNLMACTISLLKRGKGNSKWRCLVVVLSLLHPEANTSTATVIDNVIICVVMLIIVNNHPKTWINPRVLRNVDMEPDGCTMKGVALRLNSWLSRKVGVDKLRLPKVELNGTLYRRLFSWLGINLSKSWCVLA